MDVVPFGIGVVVDPDNESYLLTADVLQRLKGGVGAIDFEEGFAHMVEDESLLPVASPDQLADYQTPS